MSSRRTFFKQLATGLFVASSPGLFLPKLVKPSWKTPSHVCWGLQRAEFGWFEIPAPCGVICTWHNDFEQYVKNRYQHAMNIPPPEKVVFFDDLAEERYRGVATLKSKTDLLQRDSKMNSQFINGLSESDSITFDINQFSKA